MIGARPSVMGSVTCAAFALTACALAACGAADRLDPHALERVLPAQLLGDHPELLTGVACPAPIVKRTGTVTECTALLADVAVAIAVTQLDDNGAVRAALDKVVLDVAQSAAVLAARVTMDLGVSTAIECDGPAVRVLVVGEVLRCIARDPSLRSRTLAVTVLDERGTLDTALG